MTSFSLYKQWRRERRSAPGGNQEGAAKIGVITTKMGVIGGITAGISRLLGAAKLQSAPGADNPRYATEHTPIVVNSNKLKQQY